MDRTPDDLLAGWSARHHGLYRAEDALRFGLSRRQIGHRVRQGRAERLGSDVYRIVGSPATRDQRILAAVWRSRGHASHRTAAELLDLVGGTSQRPHVTVGPTRGHAVNDAVVHRSTDLLRTDLTVVRNIPVTTAARTLVDVGLTVSAADLEKALHRALHAGLTSIEHLEATYRRISRRGRDGCGPIGELLSGYDASMAAAESALEVVILRVLRHHGVIEPVRQYWVAVDDERFRLDMAYPRHRLFLEGDGFGVHGGRAAFEDDRWRQNLLVVNGWWPLRITWRQVHRHPAAFASMVATKLEQIERTWP